MFKVGDLVKHSFMFYGGYLFGIVIKFNSKKYVYVLIDCDDYNKIYGNQGYYQELDEKILDKKVCLK